MRSITLKGRVGPDHKVHCVLSLDIPEGPAEVVLRTRDSEEQPGNSSWTDLIEKVAPHPDDVRTKAEIDRYIQQEREGWE